MDNSEFLNLFWGLNSKSNDQQIVDSAERIINLVESKQKFEKQVKNINTEKYKLYISLCQNPCEDFLYTMRRLVFIINLGGGYSLNRP